MPPPDPVAYAKLPLAAKQAGHLDRMREPGIECPLCSVRTTVADLLRHVESTCPRRREPHPLAKWVTWTEMLALGVSKATAHEWIQRGVVQWTGRARSRVYLLRDIVWMIALKKGSETRT